MDKIWLKSWPQWVPHQLDLPERPLHTFLKEHARQSPDRPAIQYYGRRISYGELDEQSDRLAATYKYPRILEFVEKMPKTGSGKILKRVLRERETA